MGNRLLAALHYPARWWANQSLRARLTLLASALFSFAVATGAVLLIMLQRYALVHVLDSSAEKTASDIAHQFVTGKGTSSPVPTAGGVISVQVVDSDGRVIAASAGADRVTPVLSPQQIASSREGAKYDIDSPTDTGRWRVLGRAAHANTVLVVTDLARVDDSQRVLTRAALIGGPIAVLLMGLATYLVVALTLRPVAGLRHGAADITAAGLADQRLPVPRAQDEIHRLAVTLNAMLDRIESATKRQRTFVGDAAHELRSPLASLRVQLEVAQRFGASNSAEDWQSLISEVMVDVDRLDRLVSDLLTLARTDEAIGVLRSEPVPLGPLAREVRDGYKQPRVPISVTARPVTLNADPDGLRRVLINLIDNALRYATTSVAVDIRTEQVAGRAVAVVTVTDDGSGLPPDERERVFDRFYRSESSRSRESGGTGLGLPIVRDIVRAHNGSVRLTERTDGKSGVRAVVILPVE